MNKDSYIQTNLIYMEKTKNSVRALKLLANETRFKIISLLSKSSKPRCVKDIADSIEMSHSATSHQLARLEDREVLTSERKGQENCYKLTNTKLSCALKSIVKRCQDVDC